MAVSGLAEAVPPRPGPPPRGRSRSAGRTIPEARPDLRGALSTSLGVIGQLPVVRPVRRSSSLSVPDPRSGPSRARARASHQNSRSRSIAPDTTNIVAGTPAASSRGRDLRAPDRRSRRRRSPAVVRGGMRPLSLGALAGRRPSSAGCARRGSPGVRTGGPVARQAARDRRCREPRDGRAGPGSRSRPGDRPPGGRAGRRSQPRRCRINAWPRVMHRSGPLDRANPDEHRIGGVVNGEFALGQLVAGEPLQQREGGQHAAVLLDRDVARGELASRTSVGPLLR